MAHPRPEPTDRQPVLDVLRGFALLGILVVNFEFLAMPTASVSDYGRAAFPGATDRTAAWLMHALCDGKFILIFSFLFGYGLHVQMTRASADGRSPLPRYRRRLAGLFALGLLHGVFLFVGDILTTYAVLGLLLIPVRHSSPRRLVVGAMACWVLSVAGHALLGLAAASVPDRPADPTAVLEIYRQGSLWQIVQHRVGELVGLWAITPLLFAPQVFGMFLAGLAAAKTGLLTDAAGEAGRWRRLLVWCLPVAVVGNAGYVSLQDGLFAGWVSKDAAVIGGLAGRAVFAPLGAACYVAGVALCYRTARGRAWLSPLATDGRLSLTNYVGESAVCCFLFHSYGFQLYGHVGPADGLFLIGMLFGLQLILSDWWLLRFRIGPLEWLLRSWVTGTRMRLLRAEVTV